MLNAGGDTLLDFTAYRHIAAYVLVLALLRRGTGRALALKLNSCRHADWLAARLKRQGYAVTAIEPQGEHAVLKIRNNA